MRNTTHSTFETFALSVPHAKPGYGKRSGPLGQARPLQLFSVSVLGGVVRGGGCQTGAAHTPPQWRYTPLGALSDWWGFQWEPNGPERVPKRSRMLPKGRRRPPTGAEGSQSEPSWRHGNLFTRPPGIEIYVF